MELLNRDFQKQLLNALAQTYPLDALVMSLPGYSDGNRLAVNAKYLSEYGLVEAKLHAFDGVPNLSYVRITARGMDFLADDGGLGAILGVVTIKLHEETLRHLLESKVRDSDLPPTQKTRLLDQLRKLPAETTKHLAMKLVDAGLKHAPDALQLLQNAVG
ncbi:hypothetical protein [Xanthomonas sp. MWU16-30325]|uniref:hypothetical protein n=1 Tax=Xanthomonas sp. MWU16-30325 TaxID=2878096 RepID=UPI001CF814B8|nr:hypothetical protein [Xanthomonas sp. MWU16-30325]